MPKFTLSPRLAAICDGLVSPARPYRPGSYDPQTRPLWIYALDPSYSRLGGNEIQADIPFEPLSEAPKLFELLPVAGPLADGPDAAPDRPLAHQRRHAGRRESHYEVEGSLARLVGEQLAVGGGYKPSRDMPRFAGQMVYAVAMRTYDVFRRALGRHPDWGFARTQDGSRLHLAPLGIYEQNAYYDPVQGRLVFGYFHDRSGNVGRSQKGTLIYNALSHDIVVHEVTHALLDGLRPHLLWPTNPDVLGFHEGFADLVAIFTRFGYRDLVIRSLRQSDADGNLQNQHKDRDDDKARRGDLSLRLLTDLAQQFGRSIHGKDTALRSVIKDLGDPESDARVHLSYSSKLGPHEMGEVLASAVFNAFHVIYRRKTERLRSLAKPGEWLSGTLIDLLAAELQMLAQQFLEWLIRAVDYLPPVDITLGEYLRALITADLAHVPDDVWGYREAMIAAFRRYGIEVEGVADLSEQSLVWMGFAEWAAIAGTHNPSPNCRLKSLALGKSSGTRPEVWKQRVDALTKDLQSEDWAPFFQMAFPQIDNLEVVSLRPYSRISPDRGIDRGWVIEVVGWQQVDGLWIPGGITAHVDDHGEIGIIIVKPLAANAARVQMTSQYLHLRGSPYSNYFASSQPPDRSEMVKDLLMRLHRGNPSCALGDC